MTRDDVLTSIRRHLADELNVDLADIDEATRFREDLAADSLDLVELLVELEDRYGVRISDEQAAKIKTVGQTIDFILSHHAVGGAADRESGP